MIPHAVQNTACLKMKTCPVQLKAHVRSAVKILAHMKVKSMCCAVMCIWQLEVKQCSGPELILQQQPACLLTDLQGFTAAKMPSGHFVRPQLSLSLSLSLCVALSHAPCPLWPCEKYSILPRQCSAWFADQQRRPASDHEGWYYLVLTTEITVL